MANKIPRWFLEDYPEAAREASEWLYQNMYESIAKHTDDPYEQARYQAQARVFVLERTEQLGQLMQRAQMYQMWQANKEGWFRNLPGEFDTLRELMASISDDVETPNSTAGDLRFWVEDMFPTLEAFGFNPDGIIGSGGTFSKARAAVPLLRTVLREQQGEQLAKTLHDILEGIMDPKVSARQFRDMMPLIRANKEKPSIWGDIYNLPEYSMIVIRDSGNGVLSFLQNRTRGTIDYRGPKDPFELLQEITDTMMGEEDK